MLWNDSRSYLSALPLRNYAKRDRLYVSIHSVPFDKWEDVSTAEYIYEWPTSYRGGIQLKGQGIFVSLTSGPPFAPEIDAPNILRWKHPFSTCWMRFSKAKRKQYVEVFQQYFPELSFQVGCDTSFLENKTACRGDAFQGDGSSGT